jgi:hypothetical protein
VPYIVECDSNENRYQCGTTSDESDMQPVGPVARGMYRKMYGDVS